MKSAFADEGRRLLDAVLKGEDNRKFQGGFFLTEIDDADYDYVRSMYRTIGVDTTAFVGD